MRSKATSLIVTALFITVVLGIGCQGTRQNVQPGGDVSSSSDVASAVLLKNHWEELPIPFYLSTNIPDHFVEPILDAFSKWEGEAGRSLFEYRGRMESEGSKFDGINVVSWDENPHPKKYLGETSMKFNNDRQILLEADITFFGNPEMFEVLTCGEIDQNCTADSRKYDLTTTALHEIGHFLGFDHAEAEGTIMNPSFGRDDVVHQFDHLLLSTLRSAYPTPTFAQVK